MTFIRENFQKSITAPERPSRRTERISELERPLLPIAPPAGHSRRWEEGFTTGARGIIEGVITAEHELGPDEIERQLLRPVDRREKKSP